PSPAWSAANAPRATSPCPFCAESRRPRDANLLCLAGAVKRAEPLARAFAIVGREDTRHEARSQVVRESITRACFAVFGIEKAGAIEQAFEQLTFVVGAEAEREHEFVDLRLQLQFELCDGQRDPRPLDQIKEMTDPFGDLQPHVVERAAGWDSLGFWWQNQRNLELTSGFAEQHDFAAALIAVAHEARHVGRAFQAVKAFEFRLDATQLTLPSRVRRSTRVRVRLGARVWRCVWLRVPPRRAQWIPPCPRCGVRPRPARATASGADPVFTQRSYKRTTCRFELCAELACSTSAIRETISANIAKLSASSRNTSGAPVPSPADWRSMLAAPS